jgi:EmrB/QacA subfamily drug resistance transporter
MPAAGPVVRSAAGDSPVEVRTDRRRWAVLGVLCVSLLIVSLDNTILNVALPVLAREMHASSSQLQWITDAYAVVFAGLLLVAGSIGDRVGRRRVFVSGLLVFACGSAAAAFSGSPDRLMAARAVMGLGGAAIMPSTLSLLTNVFVEPRQRSRAIGIWSGTTGLGVALGPVTGGWLLAHYWWGSVFLVNVPIALAGLVAALWLVPDSRDPGARRPDLVGSVLSVMGMAVLLRGIIEAPERGWASTSVLGAIAGGVGLLGLFASWERRSSHPMLELSFFASRRFSAAMGAIAMVIFALMGGLFVLTQYLQFSLGYSALAAGLRVAPIAAVLLVLAPLSVALVRRVGTKPVVFSGMACIAVGASLLASTTVQGRYGDAIGAFFLLGSGIGLAMAPCTDSVMGSLPVERTGVGAATNGAALQLGGALGVGILGSLLNTRYQGRLAPLLHAAHVPPSVSAVATGSLGGALAVAQRAGGGAGRLLASAARGAFVSGMDLALTAAAVVVAVAALVVATVLPNRPER